MRLATLLKKLAVTKSQRVAQCDETIESETVPSTPLPPSKPNRTLYNYKGDSYIARNGPYVLTLDAR